MFAIIEELQDNGQMGVTELSDILGMSKGSIHHHLTTLQEHDYVVKQDGKYTIGLEFFSIGVGTRNRYPIYEAAKNELPKLASQTGETAWCMVEENGKGVFIDGYVSGASLNPDAVIGNKTPLHCNSAGKTILANLPEEQREAIIGRNELERMTENTITDPEQLRQELKQIREQGYSMNLEEDISGIHAVGTAILDKDSKVLGSISIGGTATRLTEKYCEQELVPALNATANDIELNITYR